MHKGSEWFELQKQSGDTSQTFENIPMFYAYSDIILQLGVVRAERNPNINLAENCNFTH